MDYDFSNLTPEQAAANVRNALTTFFQGTKEQHALLDASLALCGLAEAPAVEPPPEPLA